MEQDDMRNVLFQETSPSRLDVLVPMMDRAVGVLHLRGWVTDRRVAEIRMCLQEALVNAVEHGNGCDPGRTVRLEISEERGRCLIRVHDEGAGFDPAKVCMAAPLQHGGRGVCLIRHFVDRLRYDRNEKCLEMTLERRMAPEEQP